MKKIQIVLLSLISFLFFSCEKEEIQVSESINQNVINGVERNVYSIDESRKIACRFHDDLIGNSTSNLRFRLDSDDLISDVYIVSVSDSLELHAFNYVDNGFVIVNPSPIGPSIVAYSDDAKLSEKYLNSGVFSIWKECLAEPLVYNVNQSDQLYRTQIARANELDSRILNSRIGGLSSEDWNILNDYLSKSKNETIIRQPIITTKWSQHSPYNDLCPNQYPAGCVAISVGQIINHYKRWNGKNWDWNKINNSQPSEISNFIKEIGSGVKMVYDKDGSHPDWTNINFVTNLNYRECEFLKSIGYSVKDNSFFDNITSAYNEIKSGRPIIMCGYKKQIIVPIDGHSWVADGVKFVAFDYLMDESEATNNGIYHPGGYEALFVRDVLASQVTTYFHFNMGWGGSDNGWYLCQFNVVVNMNTVGKSFLYQKHIKYVEVK